MKIKNQNPKIKIITQNAKIISNEKIKAQYFKITIHAPKIAGYAQPGQFVNIRITDGIEPLLRRPLSIHRVSHKPEGSGAASNSRSHKPQVSGRRPEEKEYIVMLYEAVGKGTAILSQRKEGEFLDVIGPLGKGFDYGARRPTDGARRILAAGGMGTAPLVFLAEKIVSSRKSQASGLRPQVRGKPLVLLGAKTKSDILCENEFKKLGCEVKIATDDGSRGFKGKVTGLLRELLRVRNYELRVAIYACGPAPMLKEISRLSCEYNIPAQISLEAHMACGIGACMGCVIKVKTDGGQRNTEYEYMRVCYDGPVFEAGRVIWD